jgi:hypothetical protein
MEASGMMRSPTWSSPAADPGVVPGIVREIGDPLEPENFEPDRGRAGTWRSSSAAARAR